jgi:hypothetical protein
MGKKKRIHEKERRFYLKKESTLLYDWSCKESSKAVGSY